MDIVVASATKPKDVEAFFKAVRDALAGSPVECTAGVFTQGPGCGNYGFRLVGPEAECEKVAIQLCMMMQPAKWSTCEGDRLLVEGRFYAEEGSL